MKRSDLPLLATVEMPGNNEFLLVNGSARDTHLFGVVRLPNGLGEDAVTKGRWAEGQPLIALVIPASYVGSVAYEDLKRISVAEAAERTAEA